MNSPLTPRPQVSNSDWTFLWPWPSVASCLSHLIVLKMLRSSSCCHVCTTAVKHLHLDSHFPYRADPCDNTTHGQVQNPSVVPVCSQNEVHSLAFKIFYDLEASFSCHTIEFSGTLNKTYVSVTKHTFLHL